MEQNKPIAYWYSHKILCASIYNIHINKREKRIKIHKIMFRCWHDMCHYTKQFIII